MADRLQHLACGSRRDHATSTDQQLATSTTDTRLDVGMRRASGSPATLSPVVIPFCAINVPHAVFVPSKVTFANHATVEQVACETGEQIAELVSTCWR